jgi:hypothetical protein
VHQHGATQWCINMVQHNGASTWCNTMVHQHGATQWCTNMVQHNGAPTWCKREPTFCNTHICLSTHLLRGLFFVILLNTMISMSASQSGVLDNKLV